MNGLDALALIAGVVVFAAAVQLATGFGFALVCVPLLVLVIDPHIAVLIVLQVGMIGALFQAVEGRHHVNRGVVARLIAAAFVGLPAGGWVYSRSSPEVLKILIGVSILATVALLARGLSFKRSSPPVDIIAGLLTGFLTTCTGASGPPVVAILHARKVAPEVFRATASTVFCVLDAVSIAAFAATGHISWSLTLATLCTLPGMGVGAWVGMKVRPMLNPKVFRIVVLLLLTWSGIAAILTALV
ncbi:MAG: sulfite exporter TauE/SafE family protein [Nocardioidaceae bacterium]